MFRSIAFAALSLIVARSPAEIGREQSRNYFNQHEVALERVVEQVLLCQPEEGRIDLSINFNCSVTAGDPSDVRDAMAAAEVKWLRTFYYAHGSETPLLTRIHIAVRSEGFSFAGVTEEFITEISAAAEAEYERENIGEALIERQHVTDAPHHWHWRRIER
jgi:hypothetical protein